jgi:hypothetical protein
MSKLISRVTVLALLLVPGLVKGSEDTLVLQPSSITFIRPERMDDYKGLRILAKFEIPDSILSSRIITANLAFDADLPVEDADTTLWLTLAPITTDWDEQNVGWDTPWTNPGGDFDTLETVSFFLNPTESGTHLMDIKKILRHMQKENLPNNGFIFIPGRLNGKAMRSLRDLQFLRAPLELRIVYEL